MHGRGTWKDLRSGIFGRCRSGTVLRPYPETNDIFRRWQMSRVKKTINVWLSSMLTAVTLLAPGILMLLLRSPQQTRDPAAIPTGNHRSSSPPPPEI